MIDDYGEAIRDLGRRVEALEGHVASIREAVHDLGGSLNGLAAVARERRIRREWERLGLRPKYTLFLTPEAHVKVMSLAADCTRMSCWTLPVECDEAKWVLGLKEIIGIHLPELPCELRIVVRSPGEIKWVPEEPPKPKDGGASCA